MGVLTAAASELGGALPWHVGFLQGDSVVSDWTGSGGHTEDMVVIHSILIAVVVVLNSSVDIVTWVQEDLARVVRERVGRRVGGEDVTDQRVVAGHFDGIVRRIGCERLGTRNNGK